MAATQAQVRSGQSSSSTVTVNITTTAGNVLAVTTGTFGGAGSAPTRTGETFSSAVADFADSGTDHLRAEYAQNIQGDSDAVTGNGTANGTACCVHEIQGVPTTGALGNVNHGTSGGGPATVQPGSITPTSGSCLVTAQADDGAGSNASTIDSSFTVDETGGSGTVWDEAHAVGGSAHKDNVPNSAVNPTWTSGHTSVTNKAALILEILAGTAPSTLPAGTYAGEFQQTQLAAQTAGWM